MIRLPDGFGNCEDSYVPFMMDIEERSCVFKNINLAESCQVEDTNYQPAFTTKGMLDYS